jgi:hypothetical protein
MKKGVRAKGASRRAGVGLVVLAGVALGLPWSASADKTSIQGTRSACQPPACSSTSTRGSAFSNAGLTSIYFHVEGSLRPGERVTGTMAYLADSPQGTDCSFSGGPVGWRAVGAR